MGLIEILAKKLGIETKAVLRSKLETEILSKEEIRAKLESEILSREETELNLQGALQRISDLENSLKEADELSRICLEDKGGTESEYKRYREFVEGEYGSLVTCLYGLNEREREFLLKIVPKHKSDRLPREKINYKKTHHIPKGLDDFLGRLAKCPYVDNISLRGLQRRGVKRTSFGNVVKENGVYVIPTLYAVDNFGKEIWISTTAKTFNEAFYIKCLLDYSFK